MLHLLTWFPTTLYWGKKFIGLNMQSNLTIHFCWNFEIWTKNSNLRFPKTFKKSVAIFPIFFSVLSPCEFLSSLGVYWLSVHLLHITVTFLPFSQKPLSLVNWNLAWNIYGMASLGFSYIIPVGPLRLLPQAVFVSDWSNL